MTLSLTMTEELLAAAEALTYDQKVRYLAALSLIEEHGITPAILEKWGKKDGDHYSLIIPLGKHTQKENDHDFLTHTTDLSLQIPLSNV